MRTRTLAFLSLAMGLAALTVAVNRAHADVPPPDLCTSPGQSCQNAGAQYNQAGTCVATTCTKTVLTADGGMMPMTYDCNLCQFTDAGTSGGGKSSGCSIAAGGGDGLAGGSVIALALLGIAFVRRRSSR